MSASVGHRYRIQVEEIDAPARDAYLARAPLNFEFGNHDDILAIVDRVRAGSAFPPHEATALALGLKLFTGVMLRHRRDPLFADIQPALRAFIGNLKSRVASTTT